MKHKLLFIITFSFLIISFASSYPQAIPQDSLYLGQTPPGATPKIFILPVSKGLMPGERITITSDGKEIYYSELNGYPPTINRIKCFKYLDNKWEGPFIVFEGYDSPGLSINDSVMYIEKNINSTSCSFYSVRNDTGWSTPVRMFSTNQQTHYYQQTNPGNYYLASKTSATPGNSDICKQIINNSDTAIQSLGLPLNTTTSGNDFCISKDESFIIMSKFIPGSASDMYISLKNEKGNWTNPKILDNPVSAPNPYWEFGQYITKDNKYLFFTRGGNDLASYSIYWVKIDLYLDSLKHTNFIPYVKNLILDQTDTSGHTFSYTLTDSTFIDDNGNNTLAYSAKLSNGPPLPSWLNFNAEKKTFSGTPSTAGTLKIAVTATDTANASVSTTFNMIITNITGIENDKNKLPTKSNLYQNFPNPFNPSTTIQYSLAKSSFVKLTVYNMLGQKVRTLMQSFQPVGEYSIVWDGKDDTSRPVSSGIYLYQIECENLNFQRKMIYEK